MRISKPAKALIFGAGLTAGMAAGITAARLWGRRDAPVSEEEIPHGQTILILGAGFGGCQAAEELASLLPPGSGSEIILVDWNNYLLFTPLLTEAAGGQLDAWDVVVPVRHLSPRIRFLQGGVEEIDLTARTVTVSTGGAGEGNPGSALTLQADHLVIALGSVTNYFHLPGLEEHSLGIKSLRDAEAIRNRALALLEEADAEPDETRRRELLTVVVGGGGFSGVETLAAVNDLLREGVSQYPNLTPEQIRAVLIEPGPRLLPELGEELADYTRRELEKRGVEIKLKTSVVGAGEGWVEIKDGPRIPTRLLIWAAGVRAAPIIEKLGCKRGKDGRLIVDGSGAAPDCPGVWALGDCAELPRPNGKGAYAATAQNATRQGVQVARNIVAVMTGRSPEPFVYTPLGELAIVGKRAGVARIAGINFSGLPAWVLWRMVYLAKIPDLRKRIRIGLDWSLDMIFGRETSVPPWDERPRKSKIHACCFYEKAGYNACASWTPGIEPESWKGIAHGN